MSAWVGEPITDRASFLSMTLSMHQLLRQQSTLLRHVGAASGQILGPCLLVGTASVRQGGLPFSRSAATARSATNCGRYGMLGLGSATGEHVFAGICNV